MDGPWGHYAKWNKSDREDKWYEHSYMWTLKKTPTTKIQVYRNIDFWLQEAEREKGEKWVNCLLV